MPPFRRHEVAALCPTVAHAVRRAPVMSSREAAIANACGLRLAERDDRTAIGGVHMVLVLDPSNVAAALQTLEALEGVGGIESASLSLVLSRCPPGSDAAGCGNELSEADALRVLGFGACEASVTVSVLSNMMLLGPILKREHFRISPWNGRDGWEGMRDMHAVRHALLTGGASYAVLLSPGSTPRPYFHRFHARASAVYAQRSCASLCPAALRPGSSLSSHPAGRRWRPSCRRPRRWAQSRARILAVGEPPWFWRPPASGQSPGAWG